MSLLHKHILRKDPDKKEVYRYSPIMIELLSRVAAVPPYLIANTKVYSRSPIRYIPFYPAHNGGGAITLGNKKWQSITYTENFFSSDTEAYGHAAYADKPSTWLRMSAHEVGHLIHAQRYGSIIIYLFVFAYQYLRYGHDAAPLELEAEYGNRTLAEFDRYAIMQLQMCDEIIF